MKTCEWIALGGSKKGRFNPDKKNKRDESIDVSAIPLFFPDRPNEQRQTNVQCSDAVKICESQKKSGKCVVNS